MAAGHVMLFGEKGVSLLPTQEPGWNLAPNCYLSFVGPDCELGPLLMTIKTH